MLLGADGSSFPAEAMAAILDPVGARRPSDAPNSPESAPPSTLEHVWPELDNVEVHGVERGDGDR